MPLQAPLHWIIVLALIAGLLLFDLVFHVRQSHIPTIKEAARWSAFYISVALLFGVATLFIDGQKAGLEFFAGYITELSLSVDNLFVFLIIMSAFKVPRAQQQKVLMFGIVFSLIMRTLFIFLGVALINAFSWVFYLFGLFLILTAGNLLKPEDSDSDEESDEANNFMIRLAKKLIHTSDHYDGDKWFTTVNGKRAMTPMLLVMVAIGGTDLMFAFDSIPAIFGLTQDPYIVFTAVAFSLLGLRQLFFLIDGLLDRLVYLKYGLAAILGFIGVKLILHALHENTLPFINDGQPVPVVEVTTQMSLAVIVVSLVVTVIASLMSPSGKVLTTFKSARRHAQQYLDLDFVSDPAAREQIYKRIVREEMELEDIPEQYKYMLRGEQDLLKLLDEVHRVHDEYIGANRERFPDGDTGPRSGFKPKDYLEDNTFPEGKPAGASIPEDGERA